MNGTGKNNRRIFLPAALSLALLTSCANVGQAPAVSSAPVTEALTEPENTDAGTVPTTIAATEPETGEILVRPFSYQVDLNHDERPDILTVSERRSGGEVSLALSAEVGGKAVWSRELTQEDGVLKHGYFLGLGDGGNYLLEYRVYDEEEGCRYIAELFYLDEEGNPVNLDNGMLLVRTDVLDEYPLNGEKINTYAEWLNGYLDRSTLLCAMDGGTYLYSASETPYPYHEDFEELFAPAEEYADLQEIREKTDRLNTVLYRIWFAQSDPEGERLDEPEEFRETALRVVEAARPNIRMGEELGADRSVWFADYSGRDLQLIRGTDPIVSPLDCDDVLYYRIKEEQPAGEVAQYMVERLVAEMTVPSKLRGFVITDYRIPVQEVKTLDDGLAECWRDYLWESNTEEWSEDDYLWEWLGYEETQAGFLPVGEDMWYFVPQGFFSYDGTCYEDMTMSEMSEDPRWVVGGKIPLALGADPASSVFVLIREGDVYRLQRADAMEVLYDSLPEAAKTEE